jgi:hypothetical protein
MAAFGTGINAALGRIDYTPYLQGASQGSAAIGQGIADLGQAAGKAVREFYQNKETNEMFKGVSQKVSDYIKANPLFGQQFGVKNPDDLAAIGVGIKAFGGGDKKQGAMMVGQMISQLQQQETESKAFSSALSANSLTEGVQNYIKEGGKNPQAVAQFIMQQQESAGKMGETAANTRFLDAKTQEALSPPPPPSRTPEQMEIDTALQAASQNVGRPLTASEQNQVISSVRNPIRLREAPAGFRYTTSGTLEPIPGGPEDIKAQEVAAKMATEAKKNEEEIARSQEQANQTMWEINNARNVVMSAISAVRGGAGGPIEGLPFVRDVLAAGGADSSKVLNSQYDTIRSVLKLEKIMQLKDLSKTGATGFGQLSDKENATLESAVANLNTSLPEETQIKNLQTVQRYLDKLMTPVKAKAGVTTSGGRAFTIEP